MRELPIPEDAAQTDDAFEMARFWLADGDGAVSLNLGVFEPESEARMWGFVLADTMKHAVNGMIHRNPEIGDASSVLAAVEAGMRDRLSQSPDMSGQVHRSQH